MPIKRFPLLLFAVLTAAPALVRAGAAQAPKPPNILLIISDDQAWTDYGFMGHPVIRTPRLDRLAAQSLVFPRGYVPSSLCCPSLASIITGRYPHQHGVTSNDPPIPPGMKQAQFYQSAAFREGREVMNRCLEAVPTLPRLLARQGYVSLQTGKWWQGDYRRGGFTEGMTHGQRHGDEGLKIGRETLEPVYDFITRAAQQKKPFFVWYAPMMPHQPHNPPERFLAYYRGRAPSLEAAKYWAMCEWFDETCGRLLDYLDQKGLANDTVVAFLADNGWIQDSAADRFAPRSKQSPNEGGLRTPILLRWPGKVRPQRSRRLALSLDVAPTLLHAAGVAPEPGMPGLDLRNAEAVKARKAIFGECFTHNAVDLEHPEKSLRWRWVVDGEWKLIVPAPQNEPKAKPELYRIRQDPNEEKDLADAEPEQVRRLTALLDAWWDGRG